MAIIKKFNADDNAPGGAPVVSSAGAGRVRPAAGGVSPTKSMGGSSQKAGGGPGFVNISRMFNMDKSQGQGMANKVAGNFNSAGQGLESDVDGLKRGFDENIKKATSDAGVGVQSNQTDVDGFAATDSSQNRPYALNADGTARTWGGAANIRDSNTEAYDKTSGQTQAYQKKMDGLGNDGGRQSAIEDTYRPTGQNRSNYGSAYDAALMGNTDPGMSPLQAKFGNIYGTLTGANDASVATADSARTAGNASIAYNAAEMAKKDTELRNRNQANIENNERVNENLWDDSYDSFAGSIGAAPSSRDEKTGRPTGEQILNSGADLTKYGFIGATGPTWGTSISNYTGIHGKDLVKIFDSMSDDELKSLFTAMQNRNQTLSNPFTRDVIDIINKKAMALGVQPTRHGSLSTAYSKGK